MPSIGLRIGLLATAMLASAVVSGCSGANDEDDVAVLEQGVGRGRHVTHPQGVFFADIVANGSGCPSGTWDVALSSDGETFTLRFSAYETSVSPGQMIDAKDCQLDIKLGSTQGLSYAVASFHYQGYAFLEQPGMVARQTAGYFFKGYRENKADKNELRGPIDESYLFTDEVGPSRRVWSHCKRDETLHVRTGLSLKNNPQKTGEGYLNGSTIDGSVSFKWKLNWRRCPGH